MVTSTSRTSRVTIERGSMDQRSRRFTKADPTQTSILLKNYESHPRPSATQFADISQETNLPVEWIKKWFLRKRKADGKNKILTPTIPTLVENEPPVQDGQTLGHAHSKFWGLDAFSAADSNCFSPSVGYIPKFYGHRRYSPLTGTLVGRTTDSRGNEEGRMCRNAETVTPATYDLRESLLGVDAFTGYLSSSATEGTSGFHSESLDITLAVDDLSFALLPEASCTERSIYPDNSLDSEVFSGPENATTLDFTLTGYTTSSMSSLDTVDDFILAPKDLEFPPATSCDMTKDFELDSFESTTGHLDSDSSSFPGFSDLSNYITGTLDESSAFYEDLFLQVTNTNQDPTEDSINLIDYRGLPCVDFCLGDDPMTTRHGPESASTLDLTLMNFDDDPISFTVDFGGFSVGGHIKETVEGEDTSEALWDDTFDTAFV